ncbi:MAG: hypothetical protein A2075_06740 [Geobacteraceae bacterium GWC2_58_44]|nr:MAG: hypothetical protein A2075_06740 [Geobacteraceae bacterium GWC2_58_44]HBG08252.1 pilus assembly protein PilX [Geobacter sp.]
MKAISNERGVALVTALMLTLVTLGIVMALLYYVTMGTKITASQKRYKNVLEASHGGADVFTKEVIPKLFDGYSTSKLIDNFSGIKLALGNSACLNQKLTLPTASWGAACGANAKKLDAKLSPDASFTLKGMPTQPGFNVFTKIVDTVPGNSDKSGFELLDSAAGVSGVNSGVAPKHVPAVYRIEVQGEKEINPQEKANLTVLYAY